MYRYKNLHNRFSADTCTSTFVTADMYIFLWYLLIRENFANKAVHVPAMNGPNIRGVLGAESPLPRTLNHPCK